MKRIIILLVVTLFLANCAGLRHGGTIKKYGERLLNVATQDGAKRLEIEADYDPAVRGYIQEFGNPNYLYAESIRSLYIIYTNPEKCVRFKRPSLSPIGKVETLNEIPQHIRSGMPAYQVVTVQPTLTQPEQPITAKSWDFFGTGFAIGPNQIATANHVVQGADLIQVRFSEGDWIPAKIYRSSTSTDVAILTIDKPAAEFLSILENSETLQGDRVFTMGFPVVDVLGKESKYTEGVISSLSGIGNDDCLLQVTVPVQPGNSGGPLVREDGTVVGMVTASAAIEKFFKVTGTLPQNVNWAIKVEYIRAVSRSQIPVKQVNDDRREVIKKVRGAVCQIRAH